MSNVISLLQARAINDKLHAPLHGDNESLKSCKVALNTLFCSLAAKENCKRFRAFPEGYCREYGLSLEQIHAITDLDVPRLLKLGSTVSHLERLTRLYGLDLNVLCKEQSGKSLAELQNLIARK